MFPSINPIASLGQNVPLVYRTEENPLQNLPYNPANDPGIVNLPYNPSTDKSEIQNLPYNPATDDSEIVPLQSRINQFLLAHHNESADDLTNARNEALKRGINPGELWGGDPVKLPEEDAEYPVPPPPPYFDVPPGHPFYHVRPSGS